MLPYVMNKQSNDYYQAERVATNVSNMLKLNKPISCLYPNASPNYYFSLFGSMKGAWCHVTINKHILFYLVEEMKADCCERSSINKQYGINRYRLNIIVGTISIQRVMLYTSSQKACECEAPFVITDGLQSYRWSEV